MAKNLWELAEDDDEVSGEYVQESSNDFPVIPHDTRVKVIVDKAVWEKKKNFKNGEKEEDCISLRFEIEDGEFKGQKLFKKCFIESDVDDQQKKDWKIFSSVDINAGGKLIEILKKHKRNPTDDELSRCLINKPMVIVVGLIEGKDGKKDGNWIMGVSGGKKSAPTPTPKAAAKPVPKQVAYSDDDSDDIPF